MCLYTNARVDAGLLLYSGRPSRRPKRVSPPLLRRPAAVDNVARATDLRRRIAAQEHRQRA